MSAHVATATVVCPACGSAFALGVRLDQVVIYGRTLRAVFGVAETEHQCEGDQR